MNGKGDKWRGGWTETYANNHNKIFGDKTKNKKDGWVINCNICDSEIEEDNGDVTGTFGICPVAFCVWCVSSMTDMVIQLQGFNDIDMLEARIAELKEEENYD
jgi:hypothetical protein